ncbi:MAG: hypothetical protein IKP95_11795 [Ruminococcus sp.]|nr:hypothetical protein [Ruminococcus sp.]
MTEINRELHYSHFGADSKMRRSAVIDFMQDCCTVSRQNDPVIGPMMRSGEALLYVAYRQIDLGELPRYREKVKVRTHLFESRRVYGKRSTVIIGEDGRLCARSYLISTLVSAETRKPLNLPPEVNDRLELAPPIEMEYTDRKIRLPASEGEVCAPFTALRCQADTNGHINNARYADLADELIPAGAEVKRMRFEYKASFMPGDKMLPAVYRSEGSDIITFSNEAGIVCSVIEYIY